MALNTQFLPRAQSAIVNKDGTATIEFRNFLLKFLDESAQAGTITETQFLALQRRVKDLEDKALSNILTGLYSVNVSGSTIYLINDVANPQGSQYYGTDVDGVRGWYNIIDGFQTGVGIVKTVNDDGYNVLGTITNTNQLPPTGNVGDAYIFNGKYIVWDGTAWVTAGSPSNTAVLSLAMVSDSGVGTLLAITRDEYGRVTGTKSATITGTTGRIVVTNGDASSGLPTIDLATIANSGAGSLLAITTDSYGRVTGTRSATITGTAQQIDVANGTAAAGLPTIALADLPNSGVGAALVKITRDAKGRVSGTQAATTDDLPAGTNNKYFPEAPQDGQTYGRRNAAWNVVTPGIPEAPNDGYPYARQSLTWAPLDGPNSPYVLLRWSVLTDQLGNPLTDQLGRPLLANSAQIPYQWLSGVPANLTGVAGLSGQGYAFRSSGGSWSLQTIGDIHTLVAMTLAQANALTPVSLGRMVIITDLATGNPEPCWYDSTVVSGTKWRRFSDRSIAS